MTGKKTARDILIEFLASKKYNNHITVASHEIEEDVRRYGRHMYNKTHNGSTYSRAWRKLKESGKIEAMKARKEYIKPSTKKRKTIQKSYLAAQNIMKVSSEELLKAACCNLSESFETNPTIDVNFSDALTGPIPIILGSTPTTAELIIFAIGFNLFF